MNICRGKKTFVKKCDPNWNNFPFSFVAVVVGDISGSSLLHHDTTHTGAM
jgi:hypothetical protein